MADIPGSIIVVTQGLLVLRVDLHRGVVFFYKEIISLSFLLHRSGLVADSPSPSCVFKGIFFLMTTEATLVATALIKPLGSRLSYSIFIELQRISKYLSFPV